MFKPAITALECEINMDTIQKFKAAKPIEIFSDVTESSSGLIY